MLLLANPGVASASSSSFAHWVGYGVGIDPSEVAVSDFNGDGDPDIVSAGASVDVALGGPGGTFGARDGYNASDFGYYHSINIADVNVDGNPDVVVAETDTNELFVLLGKPDGTFGMTSVATGVVPDGVAVGDFNGDGDPDLAVGSRDSEDLRILLGGPEATFGPATVVNVDEPIESIAVDDFNGDGDPDLAVAAAGDSLGSLSVLLGGPAGTFGPATAYQTSFSEGMKIVVGDLNGDSDPDLVVLGKTYSVEILLGASAGTFATPKRYAFDYATDVAVADFNDDSYSDLVITSGEHGAGAFGRVGVLHGNGDGTFGNRTSYKTGGVAWGVAVGDFDADHKPDIAVANIQANSVDSYSPLAILLNTLDNAAPETTIIGGATGPTNDGTPTFTFSSSEAGSTFECRVDEATFEACTTPHTTTPLGDGDHTFEVRAIDSSDNIDPTPASRTFTVDTVVPDTTITGGPNGVTGDATPTFTFTSSEAESTFECRISGGFVPCTSPYTTGDLAGGDYTFQVRARDAAGNLDATPASRSFTIDTTPPSTSILSGPSGVTGDSTPTFSFTSPDPEVSFECRVDDAEFAGCSSPETLPALDDGAHTFMVRAVDEVGNTDPAPATRSFTVDTIAPDSTIDSGPTGLINDNTPQFSWEAAADVASYECRVDDAPFAACQSPMTTSPLSDGEHVFELRAIDEAGNVDPTPAMRAFTVDTEALVTGITAGPSGLINDPAPTFAFSTSEPGSTFECRVSSGAFAPCTSPFTSPPLADGEHTFEVRSIDPAGNVETPAVSRAFTVDTVSPDTTITSGPTGTINDATPTFGFGSPDAGATLECRVDSEAFGPCASPYTTAALANGSHTFQARATDAAGNTDPTPASRTFTVNLDTTPPETQIDSGPADLTNQVNATFAFSADEPATFECRLDAGAYAACQSGDTFGPLANGTHTFAVRSTDLSGNVDPTPATKSWIVDTTPPQTTIASGPAALSLSSRATFSFTSSEGSSTFECRLDAGAWQTCTSPRTYSGVYLGHHSFAVRAKDPAGNTDPTPAEANWFTLGLLPF